MRKNLLPFVLISALCCSPRLSFGWIDAGHKIVALVAWEDLSAKTKTAINTLLAAHPQYEKDLLAHVKEGATDDVKARHAFATAATWPDLVRSLNNPMHATHNHPSWHYIDIPVYEGYANPSTQPAPKESPADSGASNAIEALNLNVKQLKDPSVNAADKAVALCWIEHIVGDIHQPLHDASLFSPTYPEGDQGGNSQVILSEPPYPNSRENLHLFWDKLPGEYKSQMMDGYIAMGVRSDPEFSREQMKPLLAITDFMAWAKEGHDLAQSQAYLDGHLATLPQKKGSRGEAGSTVPGLSDKYIIDAEHLAAHQVALGGYRLADLLNGIFEKMEMK